MSSVDITARLGASMEWRSRSFGLGVIPMGEGVSEGTRWFEKAKAGVVERDGPSERWLRNGMRREGRGRICASMRVSEGN
jgi:hypothetical protein